MRIKDNEELGQKLRGVRTLICIISEAPQGFNDFDWALCILEDALDECIEYAEQECE